MRFGLRNDHIDRYRLPACGVRDPGMGHFGRSMDALGTAAGSLHKTLCWRRLGWSLFDHVAQFDKMEAMKTKYRKKPSEPHMTYGQPTDRERLNPDLALGLDGSCCWRTIQNHAHLSLSMNHILKRFQNFEENLRN